MITLNKKKGKDFVILNISDLQVSSDEYALDNKVGNILRYTMKELAERVKPDLITVSGDIDCTECPEAYSKFADLLDSFGIPWAPVWGNHDIQGGYDKVDKLADEFLKHKYCLFEKGAEKLGNGNYIILINEDEKPVEALFMLDSHDRADGNWAYLLPCQLEWYEEECRKLRNIGCKDASVITHIPIFAYNTAFQKAYSYKIPPKNVSVHDNSTDLWNDGYKGSFGIMHEGISSYPKDEGAFEVLKRSEITKHVFVGHDHVNTFGIEYEGIWLIYVLKTGIGCYYEKGINGGTVITVSSEGIKDVKHEFVDVSDMYD